VIDFIFTRTDSRLSEEGAQK